MRNNAKGNIVVYLFPVVLFISACAWFDFISGDVPATNTPDIPIENANVVGGSFEDFSSYATNIATALHNKDALFFEQYSKTTVFRCKKMKMTFTPGTEQHTIWYMKYWIGFF